MLAGANLGYLDAGGDDARETLAFFFFTSSVARGAGAVKGAVTDTAGPPHDQRIDADTWASRPPAPTFRDASR